MYKLATPYAYIVCKEALIKYGRKIRTNPVGTGPFYLKSENDLKEYLSDKTRLDFMHLKDESVNTIITIKGGEL